MGAWWPKTHTIGKAPFETVVLEPRVGGRWYERAADGAETNWGKVLAWDPPRGVTLAWQISASWAYDPDLITELELRFEGRDDGTTRVSLEHRHLERLGANAAAVAEQLENGWAPIMQLFVEFVGA